MSAPREALRGASAWLRARPELVVLLTVAATIRLAVAIAYDPALFHADSWGYLGAAVQFEPPRARPFGYPVLLSLFVEPHPHLTLITTAQHLLGLVVGAVVYWYLDRRGVPRWLALMATALVVLDGYAITIEQYVMPEAFFTTALVGSLVLLTESRGATGLVLSGLLLGAAGTIRTAALFMVPCWILYLLVVRRGWRVSAAAIVAAALPVIALGLANRHEYGNFSMNASSGWFAYGRIGEIAACGKIDYRPADRGLCSQQAPDESHRDVTFYIWNEESPARRRFGSPWVGDLDESNRVLGSFARHVIRQRPGAYAQMVAADFGRYFDPNGPDNGAPRLPTHPDPGSDPRRFVLVPDYEARQSFPDDAARWYAERIKTWGPVMGLLVVIAFGAVISMFRRGALPPGRRSEIMLFSGSGLAMLLGSSATADFSIRYLVPSVPLLVIGGTLGLAYLLTLRARSS